MQKQWPDEESFNFYFNSHLQAVLLQGEVETAHLHATHMFALNSYPQVQLQISPGVFFLLHLTQRGSATISSYFKLKNSSCNFIHQHIHLSLVQTVPLVLPFHKDRSSTAVCPQGPFLNFPEGCTLLLLLPSLGKLSWQVLGLVHIYALAYRKPWLLLSHMILGGNYYSTSGAL